MVVGVKGKIEKGKGRKEKNTDVKLNGCTLAWIIYR